MRNSLHLQELLLSIGYHQQSVCVPTIFLLTLDGIKTRPRKILSETQRITGILKRSSSSEEQERSDQNAAWFAMGLYLVVLWVCAVVLHSLGRAEKVTQTTETSFSESTEGLTAGTVTIGLDDQNQEPPPFYPCQDDETDYRERVYQRDSHGVMQLVQSEDYEGNEDYEDTDIDTSNDTTIHPCNLSPSGLPLCLIYPTNQLNCSWKFHDLSNDSQSSASASVSVCRNNERISSVDCVSEVMGGQGAQGWPGGVVRDVSAVCQGSVGDGVTSLSLTFKVSRPDVCCIYTNKMDTIDIEVLRPPPNITAWVREEGLLVQWGLPSSTTPRCFRYQLQINDLVRSFTEGLTYNETNLDHTQRYDVKMRVRKNSDCRGSEHWSSWSNIITVAPSESHNHLNTVVVGITLGIPMILLALLLLIRLQRERLFPPIPGPPLKIKHLLERDDLLQVLPSKCVEEITVVEEAEETPVNMACF
ncbi:uncharacterized protein LOC120020197 isoform X1 [Salvelinus namaycush]|uniref:Uncharacterized protein LOC120020197 isoform X1 n=2 Tax=Salvelinus namaycush TaxID=8040 RepID=A0A8U0P6P5_SALNM|nr:uncharacterized protein LOC120020197 isoform X1 [Salvelinus namaycush]